MNPNVYHLPIVGSKDKDMLLVYEAESPETSAERWKIKSHGLTRIER